METKLDVLDRRILQEMDINSRIRLKELGRKVRASKERSQYRIKRLINKGYIESFHTILNVNKLGYYCFMVYLKLHGTVPENERSIIRWIKSKKYFTNLRVVEGPYDMVFMAQVKSPEIMERMLAELRDNFGDFILEKSIHLIVRTYKANRRFLLPGKRVRVAFSQAKTEKIETDKIDRNIIKMLSDNSRLKLTKIGSSLGIDPKVAAYRIRNMEKEGIIKGYTVKIKHDLLGLNLFQVNISLKKMEMLPVMVSFFESTGDSCMAYKLLGKYDLLVEIYEKSTEDLRKILRKFKKKFLGRYNYFDVFTVFEEHTISWSPFMPIEDSK